MITDYQTLDRGISQRLPRLVIAKDLVAQKSLDSGVSSWTSIGFKGKAETIQTFNFWLLGLFSPKWKEAYILKRLGYRYQLAQKDQTSMWFELRPQV
ncbi:hypothetical protein HU830_02765 [Lactobacillus sp. DCY120]|uniref:Uncharacterized protein n=1 Tax=Bombilactobacillus apium TaxID=2675299 RepID=A0A850R9P1_9LACO|nr:hypothetical protein [Bombilactobacillus apium]NVY96106.1 hypothetical protein [Bombilactobacillus apium]